MAQTTKVILSSLIALLFFHLAAPLPTRPKRSVTPLQSTAESARLRTAELYQDYCADVHDTLPVFTDDPAATRCHYFADLVTSTTSLPELLSFNDSVPMTMEDLLVLLDASNQMDNILTQLTSVGTDILTSHGLCFYPGNAVKPNNACPLKCLTEDVDSDRDMFCSLDNMMVELRVFKHLREQLRVKVSPSEVSTTFVDIDITASDTQSTARYYSIVVLDYATLLTEVIADAVNRYEEGN